MRPVVVAVALLAAVGTLAGCAATPPPPAPLSQQQLDEITSADNDARWQFLFGARTDVARPQVTRLGYVAAGKAEAFYKRCLDAAGVNQDYVYGFGSGAGDPQGLTAAYLAYYVCVAQHPVDPISVGFLSDAQLGFEYDYFVTRLAPCLRSLGYAVPTPPTREQFVGTSFTGRGWDPYAQVHPQPGRHSWDFVDEACPPLPAGVYGPRHP